ncbi:hypothetical protein [Actinomyces procaprae]|uniref:hypothetical protein n=1 Tax=Actinomyces procaprae TaxID=2560010 RepID=UPI00109DBFFF|nr:hypothetical protein [Actinomyces procaprae]
MIDVDELGAVGGLETSDGLVAAVSAVLDAPAGWESVLGWRVACGLCEATAQRWHSPRWGLEEMTDVVRLVVLTRSEDLVDWAGAHSGADVWGWVLRHALGVLQREWLLDRLGGLTGDSNLRRLVEHVGLRPVVGWEDLACPELDQSSVLAEAELPWAWADRQWPGEVHPWDLGPASESVVALLIALGVRPEPAWLGTCRILELAVDGERDRRHTRARADAEGGWLRELGISPAAAGAWMSIVTGSRRLGAASAVTLALRDGAELSAAQEAWLVEVLLGAPTIAGADVAAA